MKRLLVFLIISILSKNIQSAGWTSEIIEDNRKEQQKHEESKRKREYLSEIYQIQKSSIYKKIKSIEEIGIRDKTMSSTLLHESAAVGSYCSFVLALERGAVFDIASKDTLLFLVKCRIELYELNDIENDKNMHKSESNIFNKYINYLVSIINSIYSTKLPREIQNIISDYHFCNTDEFNELMETQSRCIIS